MSTSPPSLPGWVQAWQSAELPVLEETAWALEDMRANEDAVDARLIAETIAADPLMTLKLLAHAAALQRGRESTEAETAVEALVLTGITPFFAAFGPQPTLEDRLAGRPEALQGLHAVLRRSRRAARFALAFAAHRLDPDAAVIHEAALLHDFAELLLWLHAPDAALEIQGRQRADPALRSAEAQRAVLHAELPDIQQALMHTWRLPGRIAELADDRHAAAASTRSVVLAIRLARHSAESWDNAALPDDLRDIAELLNLGATPTARLVHEIDGL